MPQHTDTHLLHTPWRKPLHAAGRSCHSLLFPAWHFPAVYLLTDKKQGEEAQGEFTVPPPLPQR